MRPLIDVSVVYMYNHAQQKREVTSSSLTGGEPSAPFAGVLVIDFLMLTL